MQGVLESQQEVITMVVLVQAPEALVLLVVLLVVAILLQVALQVVQVQVCEARRVCTVSRVAEGLVFCLF
tara:strand:+ start:122 stop:331 length:210 start_codon:yes stop_codon:yes gene_type:complete